MFDNLHEGLWLGFSINDHVASEEPMPNHLINNQIYLICYSFIITWNARYWIEQCRSTRRQWDLASICF